MFNRIRGVGALGRPGSRLHRGKPSAQVSDGHGWGNRDRGAAGFLRRGQQCRFASGPFRAIQERAGGFLASNPVVRRCPAVVHHQQHGPLTGQRGPGIQQLAYRVSDLDALSERLREQGIRLLYDAPRRGTANSRINFIHPKDAGGVLVELVEPARH